MDRVTNPRERERKRRRILDTALKIFSTKGYSPTVLEEIAQEAGIAKGTLYLYFRDKEDLFYNTIMNVIEKLIGILKEKIDDTMNPMQILRDVAFIQLSFFSRNRDFFALFQTLHNDLLLFSHKQLFSHLMKRRQELIDYEHEIVERGKRQGLIRKDIDTAEIVHCYEGMVMYFIREIGGSETRSRGLDLKKKTNALMKIFLKGVSADAKRSDHGTQEV